MGCTYSPATLMSLSMLSLQTPERVSFRLPRSLSPLLFLVHVEDIFSVLPCADEMRLLSRVEGHLHYFWTCFWLPLRAHFSWSCCREFVDVSLCSCTWSHATLSSVNPLSGKHGHQNADNPPKLASSRLSFSVRLTFFAAFQVSEFTQSFLGQQNLCVIKLVG